MAGDHHYQATLRWTGNQGEGTKGLKSYQRGFDIEIAGKPTLHGSSDPSYMGDASLHNPEDLLMASLSSCHMLWYLHFCSVNGISVLAYVDAAEGTMVTHKDGSGEFSEVVLKPKITIAQGGDVQKADELHKRAHEMCFIARSVNFPVRWEAEITVED